MNTLGPEPNPQEIPVNPRGAISAEAKKKVAAAGLVLMLLLIGFFFWWNSRAPIQAGPAKPLVSESDHNRREREAKEKAELNYERAKQEEYRRRGVRDVDERAGGGGQQSSGGAGAVQQPPAQVKLAIWQQREENVNYSDSVVEVKEKKDDRDSVSGVGGAVSAPAPLGEPEGNRKAETGTVLPASTILEALTINGLNGDFTGPVVAQVRTPVYYPGTQTVAIPQGSRLVGEAQKVGATGQARLAVTFHSLLIERELGQYQAVSLDKAVGLDQAGESALKDKVNNHYAQIFGTSIAIGALGGLAQIGNGSSYGGLNGYNAGTEFRNGITQQSSQNANQVLARFLNRLPTVEIRPGTRVDVILIQPLEIPANESRP